MNAHTYLLPDTANASTTAASANISWVTRSIPVKCNIYRNENNRTFVLSSGYSGIPENLLVNCIGWLLLILLFTILRKKAWNYGRIALVHLKEQRWTQLFYGNVDTSPNLPPNEQTQRSRTSVDLGPMFPYKDKGFFFWLVAIFKLRDEDILIKSGIDAVQYLSFQRYVLSYLSIVCFIALVIILPVNFQGNLEGDTNTFGHTTISNLDPRSQYLWFHVAFSILLLPIGIFFMRKFSSNLTLVEEENIVSRTIMITHIPVRHCKRNNLLQHFQEAYQDVEVQDIQFAYDIKKLSLYDNQRESAAQARLWSERYYKAVGERPRMRPYTCGHFCVCCESCRCKSVDATDYYTEEESRLAAMVDDERSASLHRPLGIVFITFLTEGMAMRVYKDHQKSCKCSSNPPTSSLGHLLAPHDWNVMFAPPPDDIIWENLSSSSETWYVWVFFVNFILFMILFFLTTPAIIINNLGMFYVADKILKLNPLVSEFLPTLLLWIIAALLPVIVSYSDQFVFHWTRSAQNYSIMQKTFVFLIFMVLILPSLGLTSAKAFVEWAAAPRNSTYRWQCIFLPNNGAFFVNYVITSAFIGTAAEIIRFPELFMYVMGLCFAKSSAEQASVRKAILWEFQFGVQYAWFLLIFAITMTYSLSCPLIVPFGLLYLLLKHCVDRYNIYFAYGPSKINKNIHATATNFVVLSIILLQLSIVFFSFLRRGWGPILIVSLTSFVVTLAVFICQVFFHWFREFSPIAYKRLTTSCRDEIEPMDVFVDSNAEPLTPLEKVFIPEVLSRQSSTVEENSDYKVIRSYGTSDSNNVFQDSSDDNKKYDQRNTSNDNANDKF
ncbi:TMEM63C (predicted) [Pycnogonum litorale]